MDHGQLIRTISLLYSTFFGSDLVVLERIDTEPFFTPDHNPEMIDAMTGGVHNTGTAAGLKCAIIRVLGE